MVRSAGHVVLVALVLAVLGEGALRVERFGWSRAAVGPWADPPPWDRLRAFDAVGDPVPRPGADVAWALGPGQPIVRYRLNGLGLRGAGEVAERPPPGVCRVLALGDAYTFGYGVGERDTYPRRLAERLGRRRRVEVLNGGFPNLDVEQQARRLRMLLPRLAPDVVLVSFDWWNVPLPEDEPPARPVRWSGPWLVANVEEKAERLGRQVGLVHATFEAARRALTPALFAPSGLAREIEPLTLTPAALGDRWGQTQAALAAMAARVSAAGARFALVSTPLDLQVDAARAVLYRTGGLPYPSHGFPDADWPATSTMPAALRTFAAAAGIDLVDATPAFLRHRHAHLFLAGDYHAAPAGHRLIAREVARWFEHARPCR